MEINRTVNITGIDITDTSYQNASRKIIDWSIDRQHRYVCICNVHSVTSSRWDLSLKDALDNSDMNTADGMPLVWMQHRMGISYARRVYGPTLMLRVLDKASRKKLKVALYGGHKERMPRLLDFIKKWYPGVEIVDHICPPFRELTKIEDDYFSERLKKSGANIIFVGIGCPKQEIWMKNHSHRIPGVMIGVGAAFDFHAGFIDQAPPKIQKMGLEWAYRLYKEPRRLAKRYFMTNPVFILNAIKQILQRNILRNDFIQTKVRMSEQKSKGEIKKVAVCIATYKRWSMLVGLLDSIDECDKPNGVEIEIRVVDNDKEGSSKECEGWTEYYPMTYAIEPRQNIAHARNTAIQQGPADAFIFVDDDEEVVGKNWLIDLIDTAERYNADAVFGSVVPYISSWQMRKREEFFEKGGQKTGSVVDWRDTRTSNTLVRGSWFANHKFDSELGRSGGSDSDFFARLSKHNPRYVACQEAVVEEWIGDSRSSLKWLCKRAYRNGLIYERNITRTNEINRPLMRAIKRTIAAGLYFIRGCYDCFCYNDTKYIRKSVIKLSLMIGGLHAFFKPKKTTQTVYYK